MHIPVDSQKSWIDAPLEAVHQGFRRHFGGDAFNGKMPEVVDHMSPKLLALIFIGFLYVVELLYKQWKFRVDVPFVTTGRGPFFIRSWRTAMQWVVNAKSIVDKGYYEHRNKSGAFQIPTLSGNHVFICSGKLVDELRNAPESMLSFNHRTADILQAKFTIGTDILFKPYHIPFIKDQLTKNIDAFTVPLMEEFTLATEHYMNLTTGDWEALKVYELSVNIIARGMSRVFVGEELCRNQAYLKTAIEFTQKLFIAAHLLQLVPTPVRYLVAPIVNEIFINRSLRASKKILAPIITERKRRAQQEGKDWKGRPDDMLQWLIEGAPESEQNMNALVLRMTEINMAALHTTGIALYQNLFSLAMYPQHIPELRNEIEQVIAQNGWSKISMSKLVKLDSFVRETQRLGGPSVILMGRKVLGNGFTFSNGLHLPAGVTVSIPETLHTDEQEYGDSAYDFDGFRFSRPHEVEGVEGISKGPARRKYYTTTGSHYLRFGHGHAACPGRFFASHELKIVLCQIIMNYDIRFEDTPKPIYFTMHKGPDMSAKIAFRKRRIETEH